MGNGSGVRARLLAVPGGWPLAAVLAAAVVTGAVAALVAPPGGSAPALADVASALGAAGALGLLGAPAAWRQARRRRAGIDDVDAMTGAEFEDRLASAFGAAGYAVEPVGGPGDYGADLVLERDGVRTVVQAKRYAGNVGIEAVQQVVGARRYHGAEAAMVVSNSAYTRAAVTLAGASDVELVGRERLVDLLAADAAPTGAWGPPVLLVRQWAGGVRLLVFAATVAVRVALAVVRGALRVVWWCARAAGRALRPPG